MKLSLTNILDLAFAKKTHFDIRRYRGFYSYIPIDKAAADITARHRYGLADAVALDIFEQAAAAIGIDHSLLDQSIAACSSMIGKEVAALCGASEKFPFCSDRYLLLMQAGDNPVWDFRVGTLALVGDAAIGVEVHRIVLLNISGSARRIVERFRNSGAFVSDELIDV